MEEIPDDFMPDEHWFSRYFWWSLHCATYSRKPFWKVRPYNYIEPEEPKQLLLFKKNF